MKSKWFMLMVLFTYLASCQIKPDCSNFDNNENSNLSNDSVLSKQFSDFRDTLLRKFNEKPIEKSDNPSYLLMYYSSFQFGKSIKFEKEENNQYWLTVNCFGYNDSLYEKCHTYKVMIENYEWNELQQLIHEFDFWTEEPFRVTKYVLDGYFVTLEGTRPKSDACNNKTYQFIGRQSPIRDKIGSLCSEILSYEEQLDFKYQQ